MDIYNKLVDILFDELNIDDDRNIESVLDGFELDSLTIVKFLVRVEDEFGIEFDNDFLVKDNESLIKDVEKYIINIT